MSKRKISKKDMLNSLMEANLVCPRTVREDCVFISLDGECKKCLNEIRLGIERLIRKKKGTK